MNKKRKMGRTLPALGVEGREKERGLGVGLVAEGLEQEALQHGHLHQLRVGLHLLNCTHSKRLVSTRTAHNTRHDDTRHTQLLGSAY